MPDVRASAQIGSFLHPVADVGAAVAFYENVFGLHRKFVDGDRYAELRGGGATLALASPAEDATGGVPAASFKVVDLTAALAAVVDSGGHVVRDPRTTAHETRATVRDPWGNVLVLYSPEPS
jgi:predicted enzyme related to lactoylglutathione lyase